MTARHQPHADRAPGKELQYLARACRESFEDIAALRAKTTVVYNFDFALLCPVLFKQPGLGSKDFFSPPTAAVRRVLATSVETGFQIVISGYTLSEFFDQLAHKESHLRKSSPYLYGSVEESALREQLMTSETLRRELSQYTPRGLDAQMRAPVEQMMALISSGAIRGVGDVLDASTVRRVADRDQFERFYQEQRQQRLPGDTGRRDLVDNEFHYKIDAANSCLTLAIAEAASAPSAYFVTSTPLNIRQCTLGKSSYARLDRTPLFVMNAQALRRNGHIEDELRYLDKMTRRSLELADEIGVQRTLRELPATLRLELTAHFLMFQQALGRTEPISGESIEREVDEIMDALSEPDALQQDMQDAAATLRLGARHLEKETSALDLGYVSEFDFSDDPVLARVRKQLGLKSR
jgi:hypothetical protein